jgi:hypothetical protein
MDRLDWLSRQRSELLSVFCCQLFVVSCQLSVVCHCQIHLEIEIIDWIRNGQRTTDNEQMDVRHVSFGTTAATTIFGSSTGS